MERRGPEPNGLERAEERVVDSVVGRTPQEQRIGLLLQIKYPNLLSKCVLLIAGEVERYVGLFAGGIWYHCKICNHLMVT